MDYVRTIRRASLPQDAAELISVFAAAKAIMVSTGNARQWRPGYPSLDIVQADIERGGGFVIEERRQQSPGEMSEMPDEVPMTPGEVSETPGRIVAYFAFLPSPEPTYAQIYDGAWLDDSQPYHVIHRIASVPDARGIFNAIIEFCAAHEPNLRIDTHRDNLIMQHLIQKHGFTYCGIIRLASGDDRLAYQRL